MKREKKWLLVIFSVLVSWAFVSFAEQSMKSMPPVFSINVSPEEILLAYPLGVITEQAAFSHHGGPVKKLTLPNGNQGWLYKAGEEAGVPSVFILQFSHGGIVIDVLHKDYRYKNGHSALQYQYLRNVEVELQTLGPGAGE